MTEAKQETAVLLYCCSGAGRNAPVTSVISATLGAAQMQTLVGLPRSLCGRGREEEPDVGDVGLREAW